MDDGNWVESGNSWYSWVLAFGILWLNTFRSSLSFYRPASTYFKQRWFAPRKKSMAVPDGSAFTKELMTIIMVWYKPWICLRGFQKIKNLHYRFPKWWISSWENKKSP
jgi:hypothetical protein